MCATFQLISAQKISLAILEAGDENMVRLESLNLTRFPTYHPNGTIDAQVRCHSRRFARRLDACINPTVFTQAAYDSHT